MGVGEGECVGMRVGEGWKCEYKGVGMWVGEWNVSWNGGWGRRM